MASTRRRAPLAQQEARLAYAMLVPTLAVVLAVVVVPLVLNIWISFKPITLGDLRAPQPVARATILREPAGPGDELVIRYRLRNSSRTTPLLDVRLEHRLPSGLALQAADARCSLDGNLFRCEVGDWAAGQQEDLQVVFVAEEAYFASEEALSTTVAITGRGVNPLWDGRFTLDNYRRVLSGYELWPALKTTLIYTFVATAGSILLGLFAAQLLNAPFRGKGALRSLFLFPYVAPVTAVAFTWAFLLDPASGPINALAMEYGWLEAPLNFLGQRAATVELFGLRLQVPLALASVILFEMWRYFPFAFLFILARLQAIPADLYEAANVDGATPFQVFRYVTLPQLVGILSTLFLLRVMWTFNKFDDIFLLTGGAAGTKTLTVQVYDQAFALANLGAGSAVAVILFGVLALYMFFHFRYVPEGS
ncbi:MAG TPA: sugar ABC transporter permease [Limnochorda sp.]